IAILAFCAPILRHELIRHVRAAVQERNSKSSAQTTMSNCGGIIIRGDQLAYINHDVLIPQLAQLFPEIAACRPFGTINLELDEPLQKHFADFWTRQIMWRPLVPLPRIPRFEAFGFTRIKVAGPLSDKIHDGWIMLPEGARSSYNDRQAEVIVGVLVPGVE